MAVYPLSPFTGKAPVYAMPGTAPIPAFRPEQPAPTPAFAPAMTPTPAQTAAATPRPSAAPTPGIVPPSPPRPDDALEDVAKVARHVVAVGGRNLASRFGDRDRAVGNDKLPLLQVTAQNQRRVNAALAQQGQQPTPEESMELFSGAIKPAIDDPVATVKAATGKGPSEIARVLEEQTGEKLPEGLSEEDKGLLLLEMGLRVMTADPQGGLIGALGQAGLGTMGSWREMKRRREEAAAEAAKRAEDVALRREGLDIQREALDVRRETAEAQRSQPQSTLGKLRSDLDRGLISKEEYDAELARRARAEGGALEPTTFMRDAQFLAQNAPDKFANVGEAAVWLKAAAQDRQDPQAFQNELTASLVRNGELPQEAVRIAAETVQMLQNPQALTDPEAKKPSKGAMAALMDMIGLGEEEGGAEPGEGDVPATQEPASAPRPQPTGTMTPAQADKAIEDMSLEELQSLDISAMSDEEKRRAADRWDTLQGG